MTGQRVILEYLSAHDVYPGFQHGFSLVERDEHRHIAFGVRFLRDVCEERPEMRSLVLATIERLLPRAAEVFAPPQAEGTDDFHSYGYHSSQVYGFAYQALRRRMRAVGVEIPGPERLMPGPIDPQGLASGPTPGSKTDRHRRKPSPSRSQSTRPCARAQAAVRSSPCSRETVRFPAELGAGPLDRGCAPPGTEQRRA